MSVRPPILAALLLGAALAAAPAAAAAPARDSARARPAAPVRQPEIGIGEQNPEMFASPYWKALRVRDVRVVTAWDALHYGWQRDALDVYMAAARQAGVRVLLGFGHSRSYERRKRKPSPARFRREYLAFRARYPWVREYLTWNEANHCGEPLCHRPELAAAYYNVIRSNCPGCKVVAADVLDTPTMPEWIRAFRRRARRGKLIWGLHNYIDANRFRTKGTVALLKAAPHGQVWFTETGGLVVRRNGSRIAFPGNKKHAAVATRQVFKLAALSARVRRIYFYHWMPSADPLPTWDSALVDPRGKPRPAYRVLQAWLKRAAARRARHSR